MSIMTHKNLLIYGFLFTLLLCGCLNFLVTWKSSWMSWKMAGPKPNIAGAGSKSAKPESHIFHSRVKQENWQPVTGSNIKFAVYSAYSFLAHRNRYEVLIIGMTKKFTNDTVRCRFDVREEDDYNNGNTTDERVDVFVTGTVETVIPGSGGFYAAVHVICRFPLPYRNGSRQPETVSVFLNKETKVSNRISIQYGNESTDAPYQYKFSVCVKPTFNFNEVLPLLEWIEFYKLMGVEQFTLFNMSIGPEASCVLNALSQGYDNSIKVNILPWRDHHLLDTEVLNKDDGNVPQHSTGAVQSDCVYRHRGHYSKYMIYVDLDEFLMPREDKAKNYHELIDLLDSQNPDSRIGEYEFRNAFYVLSQPDDPLLLERCSTYLNSSLEHRICLKSVLMKKATRGDYFRYRARSKYISKPEGVKQASNHYIFEFEPDQGFSSLNVPEDVAFLRHYRGRVEDKEKEPETDRFPKELGLSLVGNLSKTVATIMEHCALLNEYVF